jgi:hypothetical protein
LPTVADARADSPDTVKENPPPIAPTEVKTTEAVSANVITETTTTLGNPPSAPAVQVSQNKWFSRALAAFGGSGAIFTTIWGWVGSHMDAAAIGLICLTILILALIFRGAILDAIRMQSASDPTKYNVK